MARKAGGLDGLQPITASGASPSSSKRLSISCWERIWPILQTNGHHLLIQTTYQKHNSCQDAIIATQAAILKVIHEGGDAFLI